MIYCYNIKKKSKKKVRELNVVTTTYYIINDGIWNNLLKIIITYYLNYFY